jgi:hypothetical protein
VISPAECQYPKCDQEATVPAPSDADFPFREVSKSIHVSAEKLSDTLNTGLYGPKIPSRFASWERRNLENLAEELVAELNETKEELRAALKHWRKAVKDSTK